MNHLRAIATLLLLILVSGCTAPASLKTPEKTSSAIPFMAGVDISGLTVLEEDGAIYRDVDGASGDPIELFMKHGVNWFRLRLFVDPNHEGMVVNDLPYTIDLAKRVKAAGGKLLLDFHYSDTWADPGKQFKPKAWEGLTFSQLTQQVEDYSQKVVDTLQAEGCMPDMIQIGNEITAGMIWPDGRLWVDENQRDAEFDRLATLIKAGHRGISKAAADGQMPLIMLHNARGDRWDEMEYFFGMLLERDVPFDVIGYSYYPRYHGTMKQVRDSLRHSAETFMKPVVIVEIGYAFRGGPHEPQFDQLEYRVTPEGQAAFTHAVIDALRNTPHGLGAGVFWWHGEAIPTANHKAWSGGRLGLFDQEGKVLPALRALGSPNTESADASDNDLQPE